MQGKCLTSVLFLQLFFGTTPGSAQGLLLVVRGGQLVSGRLHTLLNSNNLNGA